MLTRRMFLSEACLALAAAGCSRGEPVSKTQNSAAPITGSPGRDSAPRLRLAVAHVPGSLCQMPERVGLERGFFAAEGLDVDLLPPEVSSGHGHGIYERLVGPSGRVRNDVALIEYPALDDIVRGKANFYVLAGEHSGCRQLVVPASSSFQSLADLKGKRIGMSSVLDRLAWEYLLRQASVASASVQWVTAPVAPGGTDELEWVKREFAADRLDAYVAADPVGEILKTDGLARHLVSNTWTAPLNGWYCCMVAIRGDLLDAHPDIGPALTRAWRQSAAFIERNPEEAVALSVAKGYMPSDTRQDVCARLLREYVWMGTDRIEEDLEHYFELLIEAGRLPSSPSPRELVKRVYRKPVEA